MTDLLFLTLRVLHVVLAGAWLGAAMFTTLYLVPAVAEAGAAGGQVMAVLVRRGLEKYMASIGGLTVVTGVYLFWRYTGGFDPEVSASRAGMAYSLGALTGIIALALGGSMIGRSAKKLVALGERAATAPEARVLRQRIATFSRIVTALLLISMAMMAVGHYI